MTRFTPFLLGLVIFASALSGSPTAQAQQHAKAGDRSTMARALPGPHQNGESAALVRRVAPAAKSPLGRPVLQALTSYRKGGRTAIKILSSVPVEGAISYRLERLDEASGYWKRIKVCTRECSFQMKNEDMGTAAQFRMRAQGSDGSMSLPSVPLSLSPRVWDDRNRPGDAITYRLGPLSYGVVGKGLLDAMTDLALSCAFDWATREALAAAVEPYWELAIESGNGYVGLAAFAATLAEAFYNEVFQTHCDVISSLVDAMVAAEEPVRAGEGTDLVLETFWTANNVWPTPQDLWTCNVFTNSYQTQASQRLDLSAKGCSTFASRLWFISE